MKNVYIGIDEKKCPFVPFGVQSLVGQGFEGLIGLSLGGQNRKKGAKVESVMNNIKDLIKITKLKKLQWLKHHIHQDVGGGIYRMFNLNNEVIYVGKSNDIHRRLHEHYSKRSNTDYFIDEVTRHEILLEDNPIFQTFLEGIFIAYHQPKYNDEVKDANDNDNKTDF